MDFMVSICHLTPITTLLTNNWLEKPYILVIIFGYYIKTKCAMDVQQEIVAKMFFLKESAGLCWWLLKWERRTRTSSHATRLICILAAWSELDCKYNAAGREEKSEWGKKNFHSFTFYLIWTFCVHSSDFRYQPVYYSETVSKKFWAEAKQHFLSFSYLVCV